MKLTILFIALFFSIESNCQTTISDLKETASQTGLTQEEFVFACEAYKKMIVTNLYILNKNNHKSFAEKIGNAIDYKTVSLEVLKDQESYLNLIKQNIDKTKFKSIEEVKRIFESNLAVTKKLMDENRKLYDLIEKASNDQRYKIYQPGFENSRKEMLYGSP